jgi:hypothetical protein
MQKIEEKIIVQFLFVESILIYIRDLQYRVKIPPPHINWRESQGDTSEERKESYVHTLHTSHWATRQIFNFWLSRFILASRSAKIKNWAYHGDVTKLSSKKSIRGKHYFVAFPFVFQSPQAHNSFHPLENFGSQATMMSCFECHCGPPPIPEMENYDRANRERWTYSLIVAISSPSSLSVLIDLAWWDDFVTAAETDSSVYLRFSE